MLKLRNPATALLQTLLIWISLAAWVGARDKLDVIQIRNGDIITGEITRLERGILTVSTDYLGTVSIEWRGVERITSPQPFDVETGRGGQFQGSLPESSQGGVIRVGSSSGPAASLERPDIVRMQPLDKSFWDRLDIRLDVGFDLTRANRNTSYTLSSEATYRTDKTTSSVNFSSFLTQQEDLEQQTRNELQLGFSHEFGDRWYGVAVGRFQQNEELGLELRSLAGGGVGRYLLQTNHLLVRTQGGVGAVRERFRESESEFNVEAFGGVSIDFFRFEGNQRDISTTILVWPNLSDFGRVRIDLDTSIRYEIFKDFYLGLTLWDNYDSRPPPSGETEKNDYGISSTVGYKF